MADAAALEGNAGSTPATFRVTLEAPLDRPVTVAYSSANGTATAGDYQGVSGTLTFAPWETSKTIAVTVNGDTTAEGHETFTLTLSSPTSAQIADGQATGTILDDEAASFYTLPPCRVADTRLAPGPNGGPVLGANTSRTFPVTGVCGVPANARAVVLNVTAVAPTHTGNFRVFPAGAPLPLASAVNFAAGRTRANISMVTLGVGGAITVRNDMAAGVAGSAHVVADVSGYYR